MKHVHWIDISCVHVLVACDCSAVSREEEADMPCVSSAGSPRILVFTVKCHLMTLAALQW